jgi:transketolase
VIFPPGEPFELGKIRMVRDEGPDVAIFGNGYLLQRGLEAADRLRQDGIRARVVEVHTLRPLDVPGILQVLQETPAAVTVEDHNVISGLGSALAEVMAEHGCGRLVRVGLQDVFPESGEGFALLDRYQMGVQDIVLAAQKAIRSSAAAPA